MSFRTAENHIRITHRTAQNHNESKEIKEILRLDLLNLVTGYFKEMQKYSRGKTEN